MPNASVHVDGTWNFDLGQEVPVHPVQRSVVRQSKGVVVGLHGVWLNAPSPDWPHSEWDGAVLGIASSPEAFDAVEGPLHGCHWNPETHTLQLHADFARQHPLFWFAHSDGLCFAFSVDVLVSMMKRQGLPVQPNPEAAAMLLTYGSVLGEATLVQGVQKLMPGTSLIWTPESTTLVRQSSLLEVARDLVEIRQASSALHKAFLESVASMVEANRASGCAQHTLLSGGLDSRLVTLATASLEDETSCLCFSAEGYLDHAISKAIAEERGLTYRFHNLSRGEYMMNTSSVLEYDGCVNYLASAHHRSALEHVQLASLGLLGSGQGANVLLTDNHAWGAEGAEVLAGFECYSGVRSEALSAALAAWEACPHPQLFKVENRGFLYTNSGAYSTVEFGVLWSPFTSRGFVKQALRLDPALVGNQRAYLAWISERFPEAQTHLWERYGVRPVPGLRLRLAQLRAKAHAKVGQIWPAWAPASMSPIQAWYDSSPKIQDFYRKTFHEHRSWLGLFPALRDAVERDFETMTVMNKSSVLTLLLASKSWFAS